MKREIWFKAKRTDTGEWVEGYYLAIPLELHKTTVHFIWGYSDQTKQWEKFKIDPETLCQYKNFVDIKNKKIFENDILKGGNGRIYKALYNDNHENWCFFTETDSGISVKYLICKEVIEDFELEIIGNIHDTTHD